jgi:adenine phosphoribosyltransferase
MIFKRGANIFLFKFTSNSQVQFSMNLNEFIRDIPDFPEQGIVFKDITPLMGNPVALQAVQEGLLDLLQGLKIDKVVGMESRGFFLGPALAMHLNAGFVPLRKPGKLPHTTLKQAYGLEYGKDVLEMHTDAIEKGERVLIHDDVLATGGTAEAACKLVEQAGGVVVQCNFLIELDFLKGRERISAYSVQSLLHY